MLDSDYPHICSNCHKKFRRKDHLTRHFEALHEQIKYTCSFCGTKTSRKDHLKRHIGNVHPSMTYTGEGNVGVPAVRGEKAQKVPKEKNFFCEYCSKAFYRKDHVTRHVRNVHHIGKPNN